jgi:hypothetical protein
MKIKAEQLISILKISWVILLLSNFNMAFAQEDETLEDANVSLSFVESTDSNNIVATATDKNGEPIEELDLYFYVKRTFSDLPIGDVFNTTDENGMVQVEFPKDLPGNHEGNVTILVKIKESDLYNDLTIETTKKWGVPTSLTDQLEEKRSLWAAAANAPIPLVLSVTTMIVSIWFIIFYIIYILFRISKIRTQKR